MRVAALIILFQIGIRFPKSKLIHNSAFYAEDMVRVHLKEWKNLKNVIIVYEYLNWI